MAVARRHGGYGQRRGKLDDAGLKRVTLGGTKVTAKGREAACGRCIRDLAMD